MRPGEWYELPDHRVVRVVEIGGDPEIVLAEGARGGAVERPVANARIRWTRLPEDGLAVRLATVPEAVDELAEEDPIGLIVLAIKDLGGSATTSEIKARLGLALDEAELARWWRRNQPKLTKDERIDNVDALSKRYRLTTPGLGKTQRVREVRSGVIVAGRQRLDSPTLKSSRERAKRRRQPNELPADDLARVAALVDDATIDATDRYLAGEIGVILGDFEEANLGDRLGPDVREINLLRIPDHNSRERALSLFERLGSQNPQRPPGTLWPTLASSIALGEPWSRTALRLAREAGFTPRAALSAGIMWAVPGSPEAGETDHPKDLQQYLARVSRVAKQLDAADPEGVEDQAICSLASMEALSTLNQKGGLWGNCITALAELLWEVPTGSVETVRAVIAEHPPTNGDAWQAIVSEVPAEELHRLEPLLESAALATPASARGLETFARRSDRDLGAWLVQIVRSKLRANLFPVIQRAIEQTDGAEVSHSESVTLGGTTWPDHSLVSSELAKMEREVQNSLVSGDISIAGPVLLRKEAWPRVAAAVHRVVTEAVTARDEALAVRSELEQRLETQAKQLETRRTALQAAKTEQTKAGSASAQRLAANLLKPIAGALDDSYEAKSLNSLQDQIRAAFGRLRVRPMVTPGETLPFDPDRHTWTGDGYPAATVKALTPGFVAQLEGGEELVLAFARVGPVED